MLLRLFLLFTIVPLFELILLLEVARLTNWQVTLLLIFGPGLLGAWLARHQGMQCWREVRACLMRGEMPAAPLVDGLLILLAGALLITPGLLTDLTGFLLLVPPVRREVRRRLAARFQARFVRVAAPGGRPSDEGVHVVDVHVVRPDRSDDEPRR